jgi:protein SCO1/2
MPQPSARAFLTRICQGRAVPGKRVLLVLGAIVLVAFAVLLVSVVTRPADPKLDDLGEVPSFSLIDERGQAFTEAALRGHVTIVSFLFTRCDMICPVTTMKMERLQERTFDVGDRVKLASFSVDPAYDTPERLTTYAVRYKADSGRWRFVTGPVDRVDALVEGGLMYAIERDKDRLDGIPSIAHRGYFLLIDPSLHIRGKYETEDIHRLDELVRDARFLARTMI